LGPTEEARVSPPAETASVAPVKGVLLEVLALWLVVNLLIRGVRMIWETTGIEVVLVAAPVLFMYAPVLICRLRKVDSWSYPLALPRFGDRRAWFGAVKLAAIVIAVTTPGFLLGYHFWHTSILGSTQPSLVWPAAWPSNILLLVAYHLFFVAIPEEMFYRGYLQTRLDEAFRGRWRVLGAVVGPGLLIATVLFAFGHSIVVFHAWHAAIVIPGLAFAWMRARSGDILAGAFFHAWCNVLVTTLDVTYGLQDP
jgi:membrane protease YdiL (CAAX protease family)